MEQGEYVYVQEPFENQQKILSLVLKTRKHDDTVGKQFGIPQHLLDTNKRKSERKGQEKNGQSARGKMDSLDASD